jgi:hypothetical protein
MFWDIMCIYYVIFRVIMYAIMCNVIMYAICVFLGFILGF